MKPERKDRFMVRARAFTPRFLNIYTPAKAYPGVPGVIGKALFQLPILADDLPRRIMRRCYVSPPKAERTTTFTTGFGEKKIVRPAIPALIYAKSTIPPEIKTGSIYGDNMLVQALDRARARNLPPDSIFKGLDLIAEVVLEPILFMPPDLFKRLSAQRFGFPGRDISHTLRLVSITVPSEPFQNPWKTLS